MVVASWMFCICTGGQVSMINEPPKSGQDVEGIF